MAEPLARSPIAPAAPTVVQAGWEVSGRRSAAGLTITDLTPLAKVQVKARWDGGAAAALAVPHGRAARDRHGALVIGAGPGEWLILAAPGSAAEVAGRVRDAVAGLEELVTVVDLTHGRALLRITGERTPDLLAKVCGIDLAEHVTGNGAAFCSSVARLATDVVRDDLGARSYLLHCERSSGQYLFDAVVDAGTEFGIDVDGFQPPGI